MKMRFLGFLTIPIVVLCIIFPLFAEKPSSGDVGKTNALKLEGKSFQGRIRATGIIGLFSVKGTLSFKDGLLVWSVKGSGDSAPYETEEADGVLRFTSHVPEEGGSYIDWSGTYDGESVSNVKAIWTRAEEEDFIHDLFLPDVVTMLFTPKD